MPNLPSPFIRPLNVFLGGGEARRGAARGAAGREVMNPTVAVASLHTDGLPGCVLGAAVIHSVHRYYYFGAQHPSVDFGGNTRWHDAEIGNGFGTSLLVHIRA